MSELSTDTCFKVSKVLHVIALGMLAALPVALMVAGPIALAWFFGFLAISTVGSQLKRDGRMRAILDLINDNNEHNKAGNTV